MTWTCIQSEHFRIYIVNCVLWNTRIKQHVLIHSPQTFFAFSSRFSCVNLFSFYYFMYSLSSLMGRSCWRLFWILKPRLSCRMSIMADGRYMDVRVQDPDQSRSETCSQNSGLRMEINRKSVIWVIDARMFSCYFNRSFCKIQTSRWIFFNIVYIFRMASFRPEIYLECDFSNPHNIAPLTFSAQLESIPQKICPKHIMMALYNQSIIQFVANSAYGPECVSGYWVHFRVH